MGASLACPGLLAQSWESAAQRGRDWEGLEQMGKEAFQENLVLNPAFSPPPLLLGFGGKALGGKPPSPVLNSL